MPYAHDQPDYADRAARLGVARKISRFRYTTDRVVAELSILLGDPSYSERALEAGRHVQSEDGVGAACDALLQLAGSPHEKGDLRKDECLPLNPES